MFVTKYFFLGNKNKKLSPEVMKKLLPSFKINCKLIHPKRNLKNFVKTNYLFFLFFFGFNFSLVAQNTLNTVGLTSSTPSTVAYSLRKLSTSYTGNAVLVRRSSDNATQNIGFTASGLLNETALLAFVGTGSGFVQTWYDQSGFNRHATQTNFANQPRIVNAGVIERQNGVPSISFTGSSFLTHTSFPTTGFTGYTSNIVARWTTTGTSQATIQTLLDNNHTTTQGFAIQDRPDLSGRPLTFGIAANPSGAGVQDNSLSGNGANRIFTFVANSTTITGFKEGNSLPTASISGTNYTLQNRFVIGAWFNGGTVSRFTTGHIGEVLVFPSTLSNANRQSLECNQSAYFTIPFLSPGVEFYIQNTAASSACNSADEQVVWKLSDLVNTQSSGNNLTKVNSNGNWDGGAASWNTVSNHGYFQFTASETNSVRMAGLSTTNTNSNFNTIQYAWYLRGDGVCEVFESGTSRGSFGSYATNDIFKISIEANVIKYYQNNILRYISNIAPSLPLLVDVSINSVNGTVSNAIVSNYSTGSFIATGLNLGSSPIYQWKLNGTNVGTNTSSYTNTSLDDNDILTCEVSFSGSCGTNTLTSNSITNKALTSPTSIDFYIQGTVGISACNTTEEEVRWRVTDLVNTQVAGSGNSLRKIQSNGNWDGGASSLNTISNNGYFQFTATETNTFRMVGLSSVNTNSNFNTIQYAWYLRGDGICEIFESGTSRGTYGSYASNDVFKITIEANDVKYYQNGIVRYISTIAPSLPLLVDVSINSINGTITNAIVSNYNNGVFTAIATNAGVSPTYQWKLNGINVGTNSNTYINTTLSNNDVINCVLLPDLPGCSNVMAFASNTITNKSLGIDTSIDFFIAGGVALSACNTVDVQVKWKIADLQNVEATNNNLIKIQSNGNWNGGASSWNTVTDNGYFQFTAVETNTFRMAGLSTVNVNSNFNTIQYAWYLRGDGVCEIFESGTSRGTFGSYSANSIFKIAIEAGVVKYYINGVVVYSSSIVPILPMIVDVSINTVLGTISNAIVSNLSDTTFTAFSTGAGSNPSYQWLLNGINVGTNSSTYTNPFLVNGDIVTCLLTPDFGGCSTTSYASNVITTTQVGTPASIEFLIQGTPANTGCNVAKEDVRWLTSSLLNLITNNNSLVKIQSNGSWNGGAASRNLVTNNGFFEFKASETNTFRMAGLSSSNTNANFNTIQYAWYLRNDGVCEIFESGTSRGNFGSYSIGDVFKVSVEEFVVKYYINNILRYTSLIVPSLPMLVDVSINSIGGTITDAKVTNYNDGIFTASATNAGISPSFQWYLNGVGVGTNSPTYVNTTLGSGDVVSCQLIPDISGCFNSQIESNVILNQQISTPVGIEFFIQGDAVSTGCIISSENVVWKRSDNTNVLTTGNSVVKIQSGGNWNGGAASYNKVNNNGYLEFTATENNTFRMAGLSNSNINSNFNTIQYAWYMRNDGICEVFESGTSRGTFGTYSINSVFKISVEAGVVKYYLNNTLRYISTIAPVLPLLVDVSINSVNGTITNAIVSNFNNGTFTATATNSGTNPIFQWKLNGTNVGNGGATYSNTNLTNNDVVTCLLTPNIDGCGGVTPVISNAISNNFIGQSPIEFYIQANANSAACNIAIEEVVWQTSSLLNVSASSNNLLKIQSNGNWNGGASSWNTVKNNGFFEFTASETNTLRMVGLSTNDTNSNFNTIQYAWYLRNDGICEIFESGTTRGTFGTYSTSDTFKIAVESNVVKYYRNNVLRFTSAITPSLPLLVDVSINSINGTVSDAKVSNYYSGSFTAFATNAGATPAFQWKLNGQNVGTNSSVYSNSSLDSNDIVTCILTPSVSGCSLLGNIASNEVINKPITNLAGSEIVVRGTVATGTCSNVVSEEVVWLNSSLQNLTATGNSLLKTQSNGVWNGGAASYNTVSNNGYLEFIATETNTERMCGLSTSNANSNYNTIRYAIYLRSNGTCSIFESGSNRGSFGAYSSGDRFRVSVESNVVRYYRNNTLLYTSTLTPTLPLLVDVSINSVNGTVTSAKVINSNAGTYTVTATNVGTSPTYQWRVNGANVGTNSPTFVNTNLQINDVVSCVVTPDASGCNTATYQSNLVTVLSSGNPIVAPITGTTTLCLGGTTQLLNTTPGGVWSSSNVSVATVNSTGLVTSIASGLATITYTITNGSCSSNAVSMITINNLTPSVIITSNSSNICLGNSVTFNATALQTGGGTVTYDFRVNGVSVQNSSSSTYTSSSLINGDVVSCQISIMDGSCLAISTANSNSITMIVDSNLTPSVVLSTPSTSNCSGSSATFIATASNTGGGVISYNFKVNGSSVQNGTINSYTLTNPTNGVVISCDISILGGTCLLSNTATSNSITLSVVGNSTPSVSISSTSTSFCLGNSTTVTATTLNTGGGTIIYTFLNNGVNVQSGSSNTFTSTTITNGSSIKCNITIVGGICLTSPVASSNTITYNVTTPSVVLTSSGTTLCSGANVVFTATASNTSGVGSVSYTFLRNGVIVQNGASNVYNTNIYDNGDIFECLLNVSGGVCSNLVSISSNPISINALNTTVSISASSNTICSGTNVTFTASANNTGGGTITYTFRRNNVVVQTGLSNTFTTSTISNGNSFSCSISVTGSSCGNPTANSNAIQMNVIPTVTPVVNLSVSPSSTFCSGSVLTFVANPTNGGISPMYDFRVNGISVQNTNSNIFVSDALLDGQLVDVVMTSNAVCTTTPIANSNGITVNFYPALSVGLPSMTPTVCINNSLTNIVFSTSGSVGIGTVTGLPLGLNVSWFNNTITIAGTPIESGIFNYSIQVIGNCGNITATGSIIVTEGSIAGTASGPSTICSGNSVEITLTGNQGAIQWQQSANGFSGWFDIDGANSSSLITGNLTLTTFFRAVVTNNNCTSVISNVVEVSVNYNTWNGVDWSNGTPTITDSILFDGDYNESTNLLACSCNVISGNIVIPSGTVMTIVNSLNISGGSLTFENNASLVQINNVTNTGIITYKRSATNIQGQDYIYWSSPVANQNINLIYSNPIQGPKFIWNTIANNGNGNFGNISQGRWESANNMNMQIGKGYIVRGSNVFSMPATTINSSFIGVPNNGDITSIIQRGQFTGSNYVGLNGIQITNLDDNYNLLGNPYPSAINALQFLADNSTSILGNVRLWKHGIDISSSASNPFYGSFTYNYSSSDYEIINFTGTTTPGFSDLIKAGQGFFVQMIDGPGNATGTVIFNNGQRNSSYLNDNFFRSSSENINNNNNGVLSLERHRIWLDIVNSNNASASTLIGYVEGATEGFDSGYDAQEKSLNDMRIFSMIDDKTLAIQGRSLPFNQDDQVPLVITTPNSGDYVIAIRAIDGLFQYNNQNIYLEDKLLNVIHDLKLSPYPFSSIAGIHNDRFVLRYTNGNSLGIGDTENSDGIMIAHLLSSNSVVIKNSSQKVAIQAVEIFNLLGQKIQDWKFSNQYQPDYLLQISDVRTGTYVVKVATDKGIIFKNVLIKE